jgi:hypothetical protein
MFVYGKSQFPQLENDHEIPSLFPSIPQSPQRSPHTSVFGVHASNGDKFKQGYAAIAKEINIPGADDPAASVLSLVQAWLNDQSCGQWLMIVDNADDGF